MKENIYKKLDEWISFKKKVAIATVIKTWGSSPRPEGSQLIINSEGEMEGSVSGGCVESSVVLEAIDTIKKKKNVFLDYGVSNQDAFSVGLACGGEIKILVEPLGEGEGISFELLNTINKKIILGKPFIVATNLKNFERIIIEEKNKSEIWKNLFGYDKQINFFSNSKSFVKQDWFFNKFFPKIENVIVGAVHIAQSLTKFNDVLGINSLIIDPRSSFASSDRFPNKKLIVEWPDDALKKLKLNVSRTALVTLTHDEKLDDPAIEYALKNNFSYIGCLGSKRTHKKRIDRLINSGFSEKQLDRIFAPVGVSINSITPEEIALSIASQITLFFNLDKTK